jgi:hypothetical protein
MNEDFMNVVPNAHDVDLARDPFTDDLSEQLAAKAPRRYVTRTTVVLAGLVLLAAGFLAGAQVQKNYGTSANTASGRNAGATFPRRQNGGQASQNSGTGTGGTGTGGSGTTGTVKLVDGTTVYLQTADGNVVTVRTTGSTAVQVTQNGALTDLTPGAQVNVEGSAGSDGTVNATKVTKAR